MKNRRIVFWNQSIVLAVGKAGEKVRLRNVEVEIPTICEAMVYTAENGDGIRVFAIVFRDDVPVRGSEIAHEVWHLYFDVLSYVHGGDVRLWTTELGKEAYAYPFGELFRLVNDGVQRLLGIGRTS